VNETLADTYFFAALAASPDQQLALWMEANRVYRGLIERPPVQVDHLRSLALTEKYIGGLYHSAKQFDFARAHYERALEIDRQVQAIRPASRQTAIDLAIDLANVASMHRAALPPRLAEALSLYRESLDLRERAVAQDPQDVFARQALGFCLTQLSDLAREAGERDAAVSYGRRAVDTYESLPEAEHLARRAAAWLALGKAATETGRLTQGCSALERAREYVAKAMVAPPNERTQLEPDTLPSVNRAREACSRP
jgi:tetratricopeptide (TPR) repeat protein